MLAKFSLQKLNKKLESWNELSFTDFLSELNKCIKKSGGEKLSQLDEIGWLNAFETKSDEIRTLTSKSIEIEKKINDIIYKHYKVGNTTRSLIERNLMIIK